MACSVGWAGWLATLFRERARRGAQGLRDHPRAYLISIQPSGFSTLVFKEFTMGLIGHLNSEIT